MSAMVCAVLAAVLLTACGPETGDEALMNGDLEAALRQMDYTKPAQVDALSAKVREQGYRHLKELVALYGSADEDLSRNAAAVLISLNELAIIPILDDLNRDPEKMVWEMQQAVIAQVDVRGRLVAQLEEMLGNTSPIDVGGLDAALEEAAPPPRRVCDEAYLMLRTLVAFETEDQLMDNTNAFFEMSFEERDEEIARVKETRQWRVLTGQWEEDEEP